MKGVECKSKSCSKITEEAYNREGSWAEIGTRRKRCGDMPRFLCFIRAGDILVPDSRKRGMFVPSSAEKLNGQVSKKCFPEGQQEAVIR